MRMERIKRTISKSPSALKSITQASNYKLASSYQQEQCERTVPMHLFTLEKRDLSLIVILVAAFNVFFLLLASIWPNSLCFQTSSNQVDSWTLSKQQQDNYYPLDGLYLNETNKKLVEDIKLNERVLSTQLTTSSSIYCLNRDINIMVDIDLALESKLNADLLPRNLTFTYSLEWQMLPIDQLDTFEVNTFNSTFLCQTPSNVAQDSKQIINCEAPSLSIRYLISQPRKRRYSLEMSLIDIKLQQLDDEEFKLNSIKLTTNLIYLSSIYKALIILTHMLFYCLSVWLAFWYITCLRQYKFSLWAIEQKYTALQLITLVCSNTPFSLFEANALDCSTGLINKINYITCSNEPSLFKNQLSCTESILNLSFICSLLLSWLLFAHSIRQLLRPFLQFFLPKLILVINVWLLASCALLLSNEQLRELKPPISLEILFYFSLILYFIHLVYQFVRSGIELYPISYMRIRYQIQVILCAWMMANYILIIMRRKTYADFIQTSQNDKNGSNCTQNEDKSSSDIIYDNGILNLLPHQHSIESAKTFLHYIFLNNLYVMISAYLYWPIQRNNLQEPCEMVAACELFD